MKVAVDVGNTHTILGIVEKGGITRRLRLQTRPGMTADELYHQWSTVLELPNQEPLELMVASVVPKITNEIRALTEATPTEVSILEYPWSEASISVTAENPRGVGADRVAGASAFYEEFGGGIIVDFGTATTLDVVTGEGQYEGGVIFPGIEASAVGLSTQAAMLPQVPPDPPNSLSFSDTTSGLQSGLFYGTAGAVERLIDELVAGSSLEDQVAIVATGGGASDMNELTEAITHVRENLVLEGLISSLDE